MRRGRSACAQVKAGSTLAPSDDRESAIDATLAPGAYTAIVSGNEAEFLKEVGDQAEGFEADLPGKQVIDGVPH